MEFTSFYAARIINILMRQCCEESIIESGGKGFYGKTFPLFENLISVIFDQHTIEKREVLMCFASVFKFVVENQRPMKEEKQTRKNILTTIAKIEMIDAKVVEAILHCFKFINEWQFKAEVKDSKTISKIKQQEVQQETKYVTIENNLVDTKKMGKATYQMDLLTRQNMSNVNEKFMKITVVDCLRCLSKAVYWFSQIDYEQVEDILLLSKLSKELFSEMTKLLIETSDYATQCYIIGAFHNFAQREYTNKDILSELLIENLNGTIYFENAAIGTLPESGWETGTKWIKLDGILESQYYDTNLNLKNSLRNLLLEEDLKKIKPLTSQPTRNEPRIAIATIPKILKTCAVCGSTQNLKVCAKCKKVHYCSRDCQVNAWKDHKQSCKP